MLHSASVPSLKSATRALPPCQAHTRVGCASVRASTCRSSSSWALSRCGCALLSARAGVHSNSLGSKEAASTEHLGIVTSLNAPSWHATALPVC